MTSTNLPKPPQELVEQIRNGNVFLVVGAGVSIQSSAKDASGKPTAKTWDQLLESFYHYAIEHPPASEARARAWLASLESDDLNDKLSAIDRMKQHMDGDLHSARLGRWLDGEVGNLTASPEGNEFLRDIGRLVQGESMLCTTNYDPLLKIATGREPLTWLEEDQFRKLKDANTRKIFHIHGYYEAPKSVIISAKDYEKILAHPPFQGFFQNRRGTLSMLYIGCGQTVYDANFSNLLAWAKAYTSEFEMEHYFLSLQKDAQHWQTQFPNISRTIVVPYGSTYDDLPKFIKALADEAFPPAAPAPAPAAPPVHERVIAGEDTDKEWCVGQLLAGGLKRHVLIHGGGGLGKTNLATAVMEDSRVVGAFPGGQLFVDCRSRISADELALALLEHFGVAPQNGQPPFQTALDTVVSVKEPLLVVLDNLETPFKGNAAGVRDMCVKLSRLDRVTLLGTIREMEFPGNFWAGREIRKATSPTDSAIFEHYAGSRFATYQSHPEFSTVLSSLDGIPLAIRLVATFSSVHHTFQPTVGAWKSRRPAVLNPDKILSVSVQLTLDRLQGNDLALALAYVLARLPAGLAYRDAVNFAGVQAVQDVLTVSLADETPDDHRLSLLAPVREVLLGNALDYPKPNWWPGPKAENVWNEVEGHFLRLAEAGEHVGTLGWAEVKDEFLAELANLQHVLNTSVARRGDSGRLIALIPSLMGWAEFSRFGGIGEVSAIEEAREWADGSGQLKVKARCIKSLGDIALARSDHDTARQQYEQALPLYQQVGSVLGQANCIMSLGNIALARSNHDTARQQYEQALPLFRQVGSVLGQANCIMSLGDIALRRSDHDTARQQYEQALPLYQQVGDLLGQANCIMSLGNIALRRSDHDTARQQYEQALPLFRQVGSVLGQANCIMSLGQLALLSGEVALGRRNIEEALGMYSRIPEPHSMGNAHILLGLISEGQERQEHARAAIDLFEKVDLPHMVQQVKDMLGGP